ncbi:MAG: DUF368 domain-containing protein [Gammaproteobacteria bacterium]|nr:DUF368 domain-containing protein [Gammaproteobacteria bacterium]
MPKNSIDLLKGKGSNLGKPYFQIGLIFLKGMAMGLSDSVPGISGGTIAVITNIYERFIFSIRSIDNNALGLLIAGKFSKAWKYIDGNFLLILGLGILMGIFLSANTVLYLLDNYREPLFAFFIGMILTSVWTLRSKFDARKAKNWVASGIGVLFILIVGSIDARIVEGGYAYIFFSGMIAICAMILPGLSGAFVLILLGVYEFILSALINFELSYIAVFSVGCLFGVILFSRSLAFVLRRYKELTYSLIAGMMVASLYLLWPWQTTINSYLEESKGQYLLHKVNVLPLNYTDLTGNPDLIPHVLLSLFFGFCTVFYLDRIFNRK